MRQTASKESIASCIMGGMGYEIYQQELKQESCDHINTKPYYHQGKKYKRCKDCDLILD